MSVTPPRSSNAPLVLHGTPVHTRSSTTGYLGKKHLTRNQIFDTMSEEMAPFFLGPMPPQEFLDTFLPNSRPSSFEPGMFDKLANAKKESPMYKTFIDIIQPHLKTLRICQTSHSADKAVTEYSASFSPDCTVYSEEHKNITETNSSISDLYVEIKSKPDEDPFLTNIPDEEIISVPQAMPNPLICQSMKGVSTAGQITTYTALQLDSQYRTHVFSVLIVQNYARLLRWDRSGAIVTSPIDFQNEPELLDFFTRYDEANREVRGHDVSVRKASPEETQKAISADERFRIDGELLVVPVPLQGHDSDFGDYVIKPPVARPYIPPGRATRTSIAYDIRRNRVVFFKDSWRVDFEGILKEGDVYAILNNADVPNVPRCSASGDVEGHFTHTNRYVNASWVPKSQDTRGFVPHAHHRIILDDIGENLENFKCSKDMTRAVLAALNAHKTAYWVCNILHRDMSPGNILLTYCGYFEGGLLIDWDLCKKVDPNDPLSGGTRQSTRTGTWQFMAADLIEDPRNHQTFVHDLESSFFILLWISICYVRSIWDMPTRSSFVDSIFNPKVFGDSGGSSKAMFMRSDEELRTLNFPDNETLGRLLRNLKELLAVRHKGPPEKLPQGPWDVIQQALRRRKEAQVLASPSVLETNASDSVNEEKMFNDRRQDYDDRMALLENHDVMISILREALDKESWPTIEPSEKQQLILSRAEKQSLRSSSKRCREAAADSESGSAIERQRKRNCLV